MGNTGSTACRKESCRTDDGGYRPGDHGRKDDLVSAGGQINKGDAGLVGNKKDTGHFQKILIPALKTALKACCQAAQTRVSDVSLDGCRVTAPDIAPNPLRQYCLSSYDTLKNIISGLDRMFIPPSIERNAPDARALVDLQRAYDGARQKEEKDKEINNKSFNRLFGGRG